MLSEKKYKRRKWENITSGRNIRIYIFPGRLFPFKNWRDTCKVFKAPLFNQQTENCRDFKFEM